MIASAIELSVAIESLQTFSRALEALRVDLKVANPALFAAASQSYIERIRSLQDDIFAFYQKPTTRQPSAGNEPSARDTLRVRLQHTSVINGHIPLNLASKMISESQEAVLAAACAAIDPRPVYNSHRPAQAKAYVAGLMMGQTEYGSFILSIQSGEHQPVPEAGLFALPETAPGYFSRQVMSGLSKSLQALHTLIAGDEPVITPATSNGTVRNGISANLCEAIIGLSIDGSADEVSFQFDWSNTIDDTSPQTSLVNFRRTTFAKLRETAVALREATPREEVTLIGNIVAHREVDARAGRITIDGYIDGEVHPVRMKLYGDAYQTALRVIGEQGFIEVTGDLIRQPRAFRLIDVRDVATWEPPDADPAEFSTSANYSVASNEPASVTNEDTDPIADN